MSNADQVAAVDSVGAERALSGSWKAGLSVLALVWCLYQIIIALGWIMPNTVAHRAVHLLFAMAIIFVVFPARRPTRVPRPGWVDFLLVVGTLAFTGYTAYMQQYRQDLVLIRSGDILGYEMVLAVIAIACILEATRRVMGPAMPVLAVLSILYGYVGAYLPGPLGTRVFDTEWILQNLFISYNGIWGTVLGVSASDVFMFVLFASFFALSGVGDMMNKVAMGWFGTFRGGPAKVAVVSSAFFGMVSGAAVANIVTTGSFTIPMMKRVGYRPHFAGAVEACASTGGMFTPPMMGAAAFVMAQYLGVDYGTIIKAAIVPALLFYIGLYCAIDFEAQRHGLTGLQPHEVPRVGPVLRQGWYLFLPLVLLVYLLVGKHFSASRAALYGIGAMTLIYIWANRRSFSPRKLLLAAERGAVAAVTVAAATACIGIVIGMIELTGLGVKLSNGLLQLSGGSLPLLLVLTMLASLILGLGLTPAACYITLAILVAPTLVKMGVPALAAHFFVFMFGIVGMLTPPVAVSAYVAASMAGAPAMKTGWTAFKIAMPTFIVPFMFVYGPQLLGIGVWWRIILATVTAIIGTVAFTAGVQGWLLVKAALPERLLLLAAAILLINPGLYTDLGGLGLLALAWLLHRRRGQRVSGRGPPRWPGLLQQN